MPVSKDFITWVANETRLRGWSDSELARRISKSQATVSRIMNRERNPTWDFCAGVARAFGLPADDVFRRAGLLPSLPPEVAEERQANRLLRQMDPERRRIALDMLRVLAGQGHAPAATNEKIDFSTLPPVQISEAERTAVTACWTRLFEETPAVLQPHIVDLVRVAFRQYYEEGKRGYELLGDILAVSAKSDDTGGGEH
jgi:transcriptional regulator with XRE-family HTH domain